MFLLRPVGLKDLDDIYQLSKLHNFINIPSDTFLLEKSIKHSIDTFKSPKKDLKKNFFFFVMEDLNLGKIIGTSMIHSQHGTEDEPHFFFEVGQEKRFSKTINSGLVHGTLKLGISTNGPSEIGGLVLDPSYRNDPNRLGKQLSFVRFLYIALHPQYFKDELLCELMPPFDPNGQSPLWEAIGRKFFNMDYMEADLLSRKNKEFILSLFPEEKLYISLLPIEARDAVGKVGPQTIPVLKMLEKIGFSYANEVDPFDGGPHYKALVKNLTPIKELTSAQIELVDTFSKKPKPLLINFPSREHSFAAIMCLGEIDRHQGKNKIKILKNEASEIKLSQDCLVHAIPI